MKSKKRLIKCNNMCLYVSKTDCYDCLWVKNNRSYDLVMNYGMPKSSQIINRNFAEKYKPAVLMKWQLEKTIRYCSDGSISATVQAMGGADVLWRLCKPKQKFLRLLKAK